MEKIAVKAPTTLLELLGQHFPNSSKSQLREWIAARRLQLDGRLVRHPQTPLQPGQLLFLLPKPHPVVELGRCGELIYADRELVVVDKRHGVLTVATDYERDTCLHAALKRHFYPRKVGVVHRLDRETSGLLLFALEENSYCELKQQLKERKVKRCYLALVQGMAEPSSGSWSSYLTEEENYLVHSCDGRERGELATTHYRVVERYGRYALLHLTLETGKKHQIRVHCQEAGCPVVGDDKYGGDEASRMALHATELVFNHPRTGRHLSFSSPLPPSFASLLKKARGA